MKKLILVILVLGMYTNISAQEELTTIILLRHAEKDTIGGSDPGLSEQGKARAEILVSTLRNTKVDVIYSTPFKRTRETVKPLADSQSVGISDYNPFKLDDIIETVRQSTGKTLLFSGHSNTTPILINKILGTDKYKQLDESDYDNLYIVTISEIGKGTIVEMQYGEPSGL